MRDGTDAEKIIAQIRQASLSEKELGEVLRAVMEKQMGEAMLQAGMDLITGNTTTGIMGPDREQEGL